MVWSKNLEGLKTNNAWKKPRLRKVLLLCRFGEKFAPCWHFQLRGMSGIYRKQLFWTEPWKEPKCQLRADIERSQPLILILILICTYFVPHSQAGSTKLMANVSAIVIKRLLITWAIITIITCVRVKTKVAPKQQPLVLSIFLLSANDKTILIKIE